MLIQVGDIVHVRSDSQHKHRTKLTTHVVRVVAPPPNTAAVPSKGKKSRKKTKTNKPVQEALGHVVVEVRVTETDGGKSPAVEDKKSPANSDPAPPPSSMTTVTTEPTPISREGAVQRAPALSRRSNIEIRIMNT